MSKDPAFLFYAKDFYEGTRTMLPEERACYIDLLIYQHQHGYIPDDYKRVLMYCSGISEATLEATLEAKFKLCDKGYYNEKLMSVTEQRKVFSEKQSINGVVGQFWKKSKAILSKKDTQKLRKSLENQSNSEIYNLIKGDTIDEAMLQAMLKQYANANANANENKKGGEGGKQFQPPTIDEVKKYFNENGYTESSAIKAFNYYEAGNWYDSNNKKIKNWKQKMQGVWFKPENKIQEKKIPSWM